MINPLDTDQPFDFEGMNPNPSFSKTKDGPVYRVSFEVSQDDWQNFVDANTAGMVIEAVMTVTQRHTEIEKPPKEEKPKGGKHSQDAALICQDENFQRYAYSQQSKDAGAPLPGWDTSQGREQGATDFLRGYCGISSRAELDNNPTAFSKFQELMRAFNYWARQRAESVESR